MGRSTGRSVGTARSLTLFPSGDSVGVSGAVLRVAGELLEQIPVESPLRTNRQCPVRRTHSKGGGDGRGAGDGDGRGVVGAGEVTVPTVGVTATGES